MKNTRYHRSARLSFLAVGALILLSSAWASAFADTLRVCSGGTSGRYYPTAELLKTNATGKGLTIENISTKGSMDNLDKMTKGECDAAFVQADALPVYQADHQGVSLAFDTVGAAYKEIVYAFCNAESGIDSIKDLADHPEYTLYLAGSGTETTLQNFAAEDEDYKQWDEAAGNGVNMVKGLDVVAAFNKTASDKNACMAYVSGVPNPAVRKAVKNYGEALVEIAVNDSDFNDAEDTVYEWGEVPEKAAPPLSDEQDTIVIPAKLVATHEWIATHEAGYNTLNEVFAETVGQITKADKDALNTD